MKIIKSQPERVEELFMLSRNVQKFADPANFSRSEALTEIADELIELLDRYRLFYASRFLTTTLRKEQSSYKDRIKSIMDEINYVITLAIADEDSSYDFKHFKKPVKDMTGFEYQRYIICHTDSVRQKAAIN